MNNSLKNKLCYAAGDIYGGGAFMIFSLLFMNFLMLVEGINPLAATVIIFIGKLWDAVTDPLIGRISDKTRSRFGRRRIFFLIGIAPVYLSFVMLFYSFGISGEAAKIIYYAFAYMFFGTAFTIVMVPYNAILSDMTSDYNERTSFTTFRMVLSGAASLLAAVIPSIIIDSISKSAVPAGYEKYGPNPDQIPGYLIMALVFGAVFGLAWFITFLGTKEKENLPEPEKPSIKMWLSVFANNAYRNFLGIFLSFQVAVDLVLALFIFYITIVVRKYPEYTLVVGLLLVCSMLLIPVNGAIAKRKGKVFPVYIGLPVWILSSISFIWLDSGVSIIALCVLAVLIAIGNSACQLSTWAMLTDIYDIDEIRTGVRREGIYSGMTTFLRKFASGIAVLLMGFGFELIGFNQNEFNRLMAETKDFDPVKDASQYMSNDVVFGIKWMFIIIPFVLLAVCLFFAIKNKVNKRRFDAVLKGIEEFKSRGNIDALSEHEIQDVLLAAGTEKDKLWGQLKT